MLQRLWIHNVAIIDTLEIEFSGGLTVLTGETGAGKSILLDALGLILGNRAEARLVRDGQDSAEVIATFDVTKKSRALNASLAEQEISPQDDEIIVRRIISRDGKSRAYINDKPASLQQVKTLAPLLAEMHGQHDQQGLLEVSEHRRILDGFAELDGELKELGSVFSLWQQQKKEYERLQAEAVKLKQDKEYLEHIAAELQSLKPQAGEEETLASQRKALQNREKILEVANTALGELQGPQDVTASLRAASRTLERSGFSEAEGLFANITAALDRAQEQLEEALVALERIPQELDSDQNSLEQLEERLFALRAAARKNSKTVDELPAYLEEIKRQLQSMETMDDSLDALRAEIKQLRADYATRADVISRKRKESATTFEEELKAELKPLKMMGAELKIDITSLDEAQWSIFGKDRVEFLVKTNAGSAFGALNKIASGGELSRFMLAFKVVLAGVGDASTLIFDEIDTGIGGATADAVGKRLAKLAGRYQVLTITHQPQVAAYGSQHMLVEKRVKVGSTVTSVKTLNEKDKKEEIARMISGAVITDEARAAAHRLIGAQA